MTKTTICKIDECGKVSKHLGWCLAHYKRWNRYGDPLAGGPAHYTDPDDAFAARTTPDKKTGCLIWTGAHDGRGYGHIRIKGKLVKSHRYSWAKINGEIPAGMLVLHKCDNPCCVNPDHLFIGTYKDNVDDMDTKGRRVNNQPKGEAQYNAKLTADDIKSIRSDQRRQVDIADAYGISQPVVSKIKLKQAWGHVI